VAHNRDQWRAVVTIVKMFLYLSLHCRSVIGVHQNTLCEVGTLAGRAAGLNPHHPCSFFSLLE
jgi:hypothetical protein